MSASHLPERLIMPAATSEMMASVAAASMSVNPDFALVGVNLELEKKM
jgi:hypothetical protein